MTFSWFELKKNCHCEGGTTAAISNSSRNLNKNNLRALRLKCELSQERLAEKAGLHRNYVGAVERGERNISVDDIEKLSIALNVDITYFFKSCH